VRSRQTRGDQEKVEESSATEERQHARYSVRHGDTADAALAVTTGAPELGVPTETKIAIYHQERHAKQDGKLTVVTEHPDHGDGEIKAYETCYWLPPAGGVQAYSSIGDLTVIITVVMEAGEETYQH
jgi:hypothetical protein